MGGIVHDLLPVGLNDGIPLCLANQNRITTLTAVGPAQKVARTKHEAKTHYCHNDDGNYVSMIHPSKKILSLTIPFTIST